MTVKVASAGAAMTVQDEGSGVTPRSILNFVGASITAADDAANTRTNVTVAPTATFRTSHGFVIGGALAATVNVPDFHVSKASSQTVTLVQVVARIESGTSIGVQVRVNASNVGSVQTVTQTKQTFTYSQSISDGDAVDLVLSSPSGSPIDLGFTLVMESAVTS